MATSFNQWLETRDHDLAVLLEYERTQRDRRDKIQKAGMWTGAAFLGASVLSGLGYNGAKKPDAPQKQSPAMVKTVDAHKQAPQIRSMSKYTGNDRKAIFHQAVERQNNAINIFPYMAEDAQGRLVQKGMIARLSVSSDIDIPSLEKRYRSFIGQVQARMEGGGDNNLNTRGVRSGIGGNWQLVSYGNQDFGDVAFPNPHRTEGSVEIVLYAPGGTGIQ